MPTPHCWRRTGPARHHGCGRYGQVAEALYPTAAAAKLVAGAFRWATKGSGAWLGLRAMAHTQVMDGRAQGGALARAVQAHCGSDHAAVQAWCAGARFAYAQLAPWSFPHAAHDAEADALLFDAATAWNAWPWP